MMLRPCSLVVALVLGAALILPATAVAGGVEYGTDNGAESVARGGASTALGGSMHGLYTNVAAGADTPGRADIYLSGNLTFRHLWYQGIREGSAEPLTPVEDENPLFAGPMLAASIRVWRYLTVLVGANGPAAVGWGHFPHGTMDDPGASRYDLTDMDILFLWPAIGLGFTTPGLEGLRFGFTFQPAFLHVQFTNYANAFRADVPETDILTELSVWDPFVPAGQVGVLYRFWNVELGAQVRLSDSIVAEGELTPTENPFDEETRSERPSSRATMTFAWPLAVFRFGARYFMPRVGHEEEILPHRRELFDVELDFVYENNSSMDQFVVQVEEPLQMSTGDVILPTVEIPHRWRDTYAVRLGGSVHLLDGDLSLSAGAFWESETVPVEYTRLDYASWMRIGVGGGLTYRVAWFEVTAAYQHIFMLDREVTLEQAQAYPLRGNAIGGVFEDYPINAGDYRGSYDVLSISLAARI